GVEICAVARQVRHLPLPDEELAQRRVRGRDVRDRSVVRVERRDRALASEQQLRLRRGVCGDGIEMGVAAVLDVEDDAVAVPQRLAKVWEGRALTVERLRQHADV